MSGERPLPPCPACPATSMEPGAHDLLDRVSDTYWRYVARHELFRRLWERYRRPASGYRVLDVGCGSGALLAYLAGRAPVAAAGVDLFPGALAGCRRRGVGAVAVADALALPFAARTFDLIIAQDVIEHVADDLGALRQLHLVCAPGGLALVLVPAHRFLWSARDVRLGHHRRYTLDQLAGRGEEAGFVVVHRTYTDLWLLPPLALAVSLARRTRDGLADLAATGAPGGNGATNRLLLAVSRLEAVFAARTRVPAGVSALIVARRPQDGERG